MLYNKLAIELLYEELKGQDRAEYERIKEKYRQQYNTQPRKTPFIKFWAVAMQKVRKYHDPKFKRPALRETRKQKEERMQHTQNKAKLAELRERLHRRESRKNAPQNLI